MIQDRDICVLVLEDQLPLRLGLCEYLMDEGFSVFPSENGEEALALMDSEYLDVGIVDIRLPGMDGDEFIMAAHKIQPTMRFLILTGSVEFAHTEALRSCGVGPEDIFYKPLDDLGVLTDAIAKTVTQQDD